MFLQIKADSCDGGLINHMTLVWRRPVRLVEIRACRRDAGVVVLQHIEARRRRLSETSIISFFEPKRTSNLCVTFWIPAADHRALLGANNMIGGFDDASECSELFTKWISNQSQHNIF